MAQTCQHCSRANPDDALYCFFDGVVLRQGTLTGPINVGMRPFPRPFVFPSGQPCASFDQLAWACQNDWPASVRLLRQGDLERFFADIGRLDLARIAGASARLPDAERGLDVLLRSLPTSVLQRARLQVQPGDVNLGRLILAKNHTVRLRLVNQGMGLLYGSAVCGGDWLSLGDRPGARERLVQFHRDLEVRVTVCGRALRASARALEATVAFETNGGTVQVPVRAEVPAQPFTEGPLAGARSPRELAEKARAAPQVAAALFEGGAVARWYESNGWTYPVRGPAVAGVAAVQQFFEAVGLSAPPRVAISEQAVTLRGETGERLQYALTLQAEERRPVYAWATSDQAWLHVGPPRADGRFATIPLVVPAVPGRPGDTLLAQVHVRSNGNQQFVVPVRVVVATASIPAPRPPVLVAAAPAPLLPVPLPEPELLAVPEDEPILVGQVSNLPAPMPVSNLAREPRGMPRWAHALPLVLLLLAVLGILVRDSRTEGKGDDTLAEVGPEEDVVSIPPVDPEPRIEVRFHDDMRFGILMAQRPGGTAEPKRLTYSDDGFTNNTCVRIGGRDRTFGEPGDGDWRERDADLGDAPDGRPRLGRRSVFRFSEGVEVTQVVEVVPGDQAVEDEAGRPRRLLDTCLVRYTLENRTAEPHSVGLRFLLDTLIGSNDGVPFTIPGSEGLVSTSRAFRTLASVPDFIQALERGDLRDPGTVSHLTLRLGGRLESPGRVLLTRWRATKQWDLSVQSFRDDSACVLYWPERELPPGGRREVGFAYGLGNVSSGESGGALGITLARGVFRPREAFQVTAYVNNPLPNEALTLELPEGFRLEEGERRRDVPPLPPGATNRNSVVTWKVRAPEQQKKYRLVVRSTRGVAQGKTIVVLEPRGAGADPGIFR